MKAKKFTSLLYYIAACCFYIVAAIKFFGDGDSNSGVVWLSLGSAMLCLGTVWFKKTKTDNSDKEE